MPPYSELWGIWMKSSERTRESRLKKFFNLTIEEWEEINAYQNGVCAVCHRKQKSGKRLALDHSHRSGVCRGLLCSTCNRLLGRIERTYSIDTDLLFILMNFHTYLYTPPATLALRREVKTFAGRFGTKRHKKFLAKK